MVANNIYLRATTCHSMKGKLHKLVYDVVSTVKVGEDITWEFITPTAKPGAAKADAKPAAAKK